MIEFDENDSIAYKVFYTIKNNRGITMSKVSDAIGETKNNTSAAITQMCKQGKIKKTGRCGHYRYEVVKRAQPPRQYKKDDFESKDAKMVVVKTSKGNTIFDECRSNWQGYALNKLLGEVRA